MLRRISWAVCEFQTSSMACVRQLPNGVVSHVGAHTQTLPFGWTSNRSHGLPQNLPRRSFCRAAPSRLRSCCLGNDWVSNGTLVLSGLDNVVLRSICVPRHAPRKEGTGRASRPYLLLARLRHAHQPKLSPNQRLDQAREHDLGEGRLQDEPITERTTGSPA